MSDAPEIAAVPIADAIPSPTNSWRPLEAAMITDYNWGVGGLLSYILVHLAPGLLGIDSNALTMRIAASFSGWICVLFLTRTSYRVMPLWIAAILTLCMLGFPPLAWVFIGFILVTATQEIRKAGYRFGIFGNAKPPADAMVPTATAL